VTEHSGRAGRPCPSPIHAQLDHEALWQLAAGVMRRHNIEVNDLYQAVEARLEELQFENDVHFRPKGSRILGEQVASSIRAVLETRRRRSSLSVGTANSSTAREIATGRTY